MVHAERVVELLKATGMSGYEAKAYVALVAAGRPLNGYEVAKASAVPRSTVYETLAKLVSRGAAFEVNVADAGTAYLALPAETFVGRLRRELESTVDALAAALPTVAAPPEASLVQHLNGTEAVLARMTDVIEGARESVFASLWPEEAAVLAPSLRRARRRGVDVNVLSFGELDADVGVVYHHRYSSPEVVLARLGARVLTVVADRDAVCVGASIGGETTGMWSDDPAVVLVAAEYVRHDIALQLLAERVGATEVDRFWPTDPELERLRATSSVTADGRAPRAEDRDRSDGARPAGAAPPRRRARNSARR